MYKEKDYNLLFDKHPQPMWIYELDSWRFLAVNEAAILLYGYSREEFLRMNGKDIRLPEEIPRFLKQSVKFKTRKRDETFQDAGLWQHRAKDGRLLTVRAAWSIIDWDETKACMTCINDLTSETKAQKLQKEESKFRGLLEAAPDAMIIVDPGCTIALLNAQAEKLFGYSRAELLGQQMDLVVPESCRALHPQHHAGHFRDPHTWPMTAALELMGRRKDGSEFPSEIIFSPMEIGEDLLVTAVIRDVTERNHHADELESMRRQAEEANRLKSEFLANMSHELRTPLNSVIGFSELIYDGKAGPVTTNQKEYLGDVLTSARHLLQLINDILDLAKVEAGKIQFRPETLALGALIKEVCGNLRPIAEGKKIGVTVEITPGLGTVEADPGRLKQVLYNYLSNALKFTPQGGRVHVLARPEGGGFFHLAVQDTGVGIPSEDLGRLFVAFQQLDESASKKFQGTGLGLALTKKIVEAQGGHVGVESAPGQGTVFYADLPRKPL